MQSTVYGKIWQLVHPPIVLSAIKMYHNFKLSVHNLLFILETNFPKYSFLCAIIAVLGSQGFVVK